MADPELVVSDYQNALATLPDQVQELILTSAKQQAAERTRHEAEKRPFELMVNFVKMYRRSCADGPESDSNIEGWTESWDHAGKEVLRFLSEKETVEPLTETEELAKDAAARTSLLLDLQAYRTPEVDLYTAANVDSEQLLESVKGVLRAQLTEFGIEARLTELHELDQLSSIMNPQIWSFGTVFEGIVLPSCDRLVAALESAGVTLPVIGEDGLLDEEREEDED